MDIHFVLSEMSAEGIGRVAVARKNKSSAVILYEVYQAQRGIRLAAVPARDRARVYLKRQSGLYKTERRRFGAFGIASVRLVKQRGALAEFRCQIKMPDNIASGAVGYLCDGAVILCGKCIHIAAEEPLCRAAQDIGQNDRLFEYGCDVSRRKR